MHTDLPTLWLIPARGGSKGIPGKNIRPFCGRPLVCRAVDQALKCAEADDVVFVSTDSEEIRNAAETCGITVPWLRSAELASDTASTADVITDTLRRFDARGKRFERIVLLQPTSPMRTTDDIRNALRAWRPDIDMAVSVCEAKANPYFNAFEQNDEGFLHLSKGDGSFTRRQDAPKVWEYNGAVYVISTPSILAGPMSRFAKIVPVEMDASRSVDLDTPADWQIAEILFDNQAKENR